MCLRECVVFSCCLTSAPSAQDLAVISSEKTAPTVVTFPMFVTHSVVLTHLTALSMESTRYVCIRIYIPAIQCMYRM